MMKMVDKIPYFRSPRGIVALTWLVLTLGPILFFFLAPTKFDAWMSTLPNSAVIYWIVGSIGLIFAAIITNTFSCPRCNRAFTVSITDSKHIGTESKPYEYRTGQQGEVVNTRMERVERHEESNKCNACGHTWKTQRTRNLDAHSRPK